ncbi:MAG: hypothetical protein DWQ10_01565 [Calditrichaeota bacterium]|nr:MAG: hypothetical protein DWQ10_01565 [Calditrichota bacterium]
MYSPKISQDLIPMLKLISNSSGKPMTYVVNTILSYSLYVFFLMLGPEPNLHESLRTLIDDSNKEIKNGK